MQGKRICIALAPIILGILIFAGHETTRCIQMIFDVRQLAQHTLSGHSSIAIILLIYIIALAIPFVPGVELGLLILAIFGTSMSGLVYLATFIGLMLSFAVGRFIPTVALQRLLLRFGLTRLANFVIESSSCVGQLSSQQLKQLNVPSWLKILLNHRLCSLILIINLPGNAILGGGGGIAMIAGMTRFFSLSEFVVGVLIAIAPIPVLLIVLSHLGL